MGVVYIQLQTRNMWMQVRFLNVWWTMKALRGHNVYSLIIAPPASEHVPLLVSGIDALHTTLQQHHFYWQK